MIDPLAFTADLDHATERLLATAADIDDTAVRAASLLPGWTRGHVLTHLARNADSYGNLLTWARTGIETPQYPSMEARAADITAGAGRPAGEHIADVREACARLDRMIRDLPPAAWTAKIRYNSGREVAAANVVWSRLREVEIHHVDLGLRYVPGDWSEAFTPHLLHEIAANQSPAGDGFVVRATDLGTKVVIAGGGGTTVSGPARNLAAWLIGRSDGVGLTVHPAAPLPQVPAWM